MTVGSKLVQRILNGGKLFTVNFVEGAIVASGLKDPIAFNLEERRLALKEGLRLKIGKRGTEHLNNVHRDFASGLSGTGKPSSEGTKPRVKREVKNPTKLCALCGVTAGLKLCSGCQSIAFCCREHHVENWPQHKADCKAIQKKQKGKKKSRVCY
jgi:hypothetical protein